MVLFDILFTFRFVVQIYQSEIYRITVDYINHLVTMEQRYPFTMGSEEFNRMKNSALHEFKVQLEMARNPHLYGNYPGGNSYGSGSNINNNSNPMKSNNDSSSNNNNNNNNTNNMHSIHRALAALAEAGYTGLTPRDLTRLRDTTSPEDEEVLQVMAASDAYFRLAFKRFGDNVPMHIDYLFLGRFGEGLEKEVVGRLGVLEKETGALTGLLVEDRYVDGRRRTLYEKRQRLEGVWQTLHEFAF
jgi:hypothetical protein